jgi:DNA-binding response OmpR family regulator
MEPTQSPLKVVIVEDNTALADIYKTRLEILGYTCFVAYDGEDAVATIERELPNLVLLDLMVPKLAGDQILATMRQNAWGKDIKVLIISNLNEADAPEGLREMGIAGYVVKANLTNDQLDRFVDAILKPEGQTESTLLETPGSEQYPSDIPVTATIPVTPAPPEAAAPAQEIQMPTVASTTPVAPANPVASPGTSSGNDEPQQNSNDNNHGQASENRNSGLGQLPRQE